MSAARPCWVILLGGCLTVFCAAQPAEIDRDRYRNEPPVDQELPPAGFWPTDLMMERIIDRITEDMGDTYDFDDYQLYQTRELFKERFPTWFNQNRGEIQRLSNRYIEALLAGEPPPIDDVANWAERTQPLVTEFADLFEDVSGDMRQYMTEDQQALLDGHVAAFRVGVGFLEQRLGNWAEGQFDPETDWPGGARHAEAERERERRVREEMLVAERAARGELVRQPDGTLAPPDRPGASSDATPEAAAAKDEWTLYVEDFIRRYRLTPEQTSRAYRYLNLIKQQRDRYLARHQERFAQAEREARSEDERVRQQAEQILEERQKTLDNKFTLLKEKLSKLPTRRQRLDAAQASPASAEDEAPAEGGS